MSLRYGGELRCSVQYHRHVGCALGRCLLTLDWGEVATLVSALTKQKTQDDATAVGPR